METVERVAHRTTGLGGAVLRRYENNGPYAGDLAGSWATVRFDDGDTIDCPLSTLITA